MAILRYKEFPHIGSGFAIKTQSIPPAGLITVLRAARQGSYNLFRYSKDGGKTFTEWTTLTSETLRELGSLKTTFDFVLEYATNVVSQAKSRSFISPYDEPLSTIIYDKTIFKTFFDSNDPQVLGWAVNVLEKLFEPGVVPMYMKRDNENDYNSFFLTITHFFAFVVIYARQFRQLENSDLLMKEFIEGWGLVYENINTLEQRRYLFNNWINEFSKRGTFQVVETGGTIEGELRRLVGYTKPNEFIFAVLAPQNVGWCLGWSSPTWYGTETVNAVSKGWDFGPDYTGDVFSDLVSFGEEEVEMPENGGEFKNQLITDENYSWDIYTDSEDAPSSFSSLASIGVGPLSDYPILGEVERKFYDNMYIFKPAGSGRSGVSSEEDMNKLMEVYPGLDYEVTVWVKAVSEGAQNIGFGVNCYNGNKELIRQVRITDWSETNSFFDGEQYQSPCKVPGIYYRLRGIIYNILEEKDEDLYLNFENGSPLRFIGDVKYMAPYIVQNRTGEVSDIYIAGITLKPLELPFSQGYLGQKNVIAMYSQINSARTKQDIEEFVRRYLVSYKNVVSYTWLDWVTRTSWFLTFYVRRELDNAPVEGAKVELNNGFVSYTDETGYVRFEIPFDTEISWVIEAKGISTTGNVLMNKDQTLNITMNLPLDVNVDIIQEGWGTVEVEGSRLPRTEITLTATPTAGYKFIKWVFVSDEGAEDPRNPTQYWIGTKDVNVQAIFERDSELTFSPNKVIIPAQGGVADLIVSSSKKWAIEPLPDSWATVTPMSGDAGDTPLRVEIDQEGQ